ncbi:MAG: metal-dependent hydrolase, partial [Pirellulales bacterium]|nr:metal-dependent hydrolase [Pirellulales bacterium]
MAGFKTHITTSSLLGVGYTGLGLYAGLPVESALIAGGLCGIGGMLPDIDSDSGIPFRESMGFAAAIVPLLLLDRFRQLHLNTEQIVLLSGTMYLFVRFGVARLLASYTVHRGMFHSLPAAATFTGVAFLLCDFNNLQLRYFIAGGVLLGVMSHLVLDEIYAVEWSGGRWRFKK